MRKIIPCISVFCVFTFIVPFVLSAMPSAEMTKNTSQQFQISNSARELGVIILKDLTIAEGIITFNTFTGGCTEKSSFTVHVKKEKGISENSPHYVLTIERIKIDECKAFFPEGIVIEYNLEKDLGLKGDYTISITNWITGL
ncbi:MAG: hypothetical protein JXJ04_06060 [Spirochaetales bacterium]|nr:hypothetical protein [Spirochaetales bacterium]